MHAIETYLVQGSLTLSLALLWNRDTNGIRPIATLNIVHFRDHLKEDEKRAPSMIRTHDLRVTFNHNQASTTKYTDSRMDTRSVCRTPRM